ncbi:MAG: vitamin B12-dependent ribonucleotide reductase [Pisciglobus halotolerans]|nr:vitamin B12-dependent ribonucleotide reductase [Pisciglobus halotolerans]
MNILSKPTVNKEKLNNDVLNFPDVFPITEDMEMTFSGVSRLILLDRYAFKDTAQQTLSEGDLVVVTLKEDSQYPARGIGFVDSLLWSEQKAVILVDEDYRGQLEDEEEQQTGLITRSLGVVEKPLEVYYEQIAKRNAAGLSAVEATTEKQQTAFEQFYKELKALNVVPAGRVLYGAGSGIDVTYFNCYVMPYMPDSRAGISDHRKQVMEIMSRGGGVGTNGSTLRPRHSLVHGVNGKSSGSVSWLNDLAQLTHLVEQGGSRRGAQMIMLADWHPDILEFIISKMQNPAILHFLIETTEDEEIKEQAKNKLKFVSYTAQEKAVYQTVLQSSKLTGAEEIEPAVVKEAEKNLAAGGRYSVQDPEFLTGANISVCLTDDFMEAVENDSDYALRFPDIEHYSDEEMEDYDRYWSEIGDVREWEKSGRRVKTYRTIRARELWNLISICATYAAEPGIFFIDNANKMTNATAYGQKVVGTNPCGEQPLAPYSVCNLAAVNLAEMVKKEEGVVDYDKLINTVKTSIRMQDNVIDATPYFLEENKKQALGERRIGLGIMGLADLLIYCGQKYGSKESNRLIDTLFQTFSKAAYEESIELAKERGSFPFLVGETEEETQRLRQRFIDSGFMRQMPEKIRQDILTYGIRNSHLLTIAPTGSTGTMVGVSTGLEPYFSFSYYRSGRLGKFIEVNADIVQEYLAEHPETDNNHLPDYFISAMELSPEEHVDTQTTIQKWIDSSISKTVNAPAGYSVEQVQGIYERLYKGGAKGGTVYVDGSRDTQVLTLKAEQTTEQSTESTYNTEESSSQLETASEETYGNEIGNTCPVCRVGTVEDIGGCNTCTNCHIQLKCGL